jgi:hypothetical protein
LWIVPEAEELVSDATHRLVNQLLNAALRHVDAYASLHPGHWNNTRCVTTALSIVHCYLDRLVDLASIRIDDRSDYLLNFAEQSMFLEPRLAQSLEITDEDIPLP